MKAIESQESVGLGIRVIACGAWGFASTSLLTQESVRETAAKAVEIARASASANREPVEMAPENSYVAVWKTPYLIDPFEVSNRLLDPEQDPLLNFDRCRARIRYLDRDHVEADLRKDFPPHTEQHGQESGL